MALAKIRWLLFLIMACLSSLTLYASPVLAQGEPTGFNTVQLWLNPEYDDSRLLVMLQGKITGATAPVRVRFLVPAAAQMYSAGSIDSQGQYSGGPPDRVPSPIPYWDEISYELKTDTFRVEYYDPIIFGRPEKTIAYDFRWLYPISDLRVLVQEPKKSSNFVVVPQSKTTSIEGGFTVHTYTYLNLKDNPLHFDISYTKSDPMSTVLGIGLMAGTILLAGGMFFWLFKSRARSRRYTAKSGKNTTSKRDKGKFCRECGKPIDSTSRFCTNCGNRVGS